MLRFRDVDEGSKLYRIRTYSDGFVGFEIFHVVSIRATTDTGYVFESKIPEDNITIPANLLPGTEFVVDCGLGERAHILADPVQAKKVFESKAKLYIDLQRANIEQQEISLRRFVEFNSTEDESLTALRELRVVTEVAAGMKIVKEKFVKEINHVLLHEQHREETKKFLSLYTYEDLGGPNVKVVKLRPHKLMPGANSYGIMVGLSDRRTTMVNVNIGKFEEYVKNCWKTLQGLSDND